MKYSPKLVAAIAIAAAIIVGFTSVTASQPTEQKVVRADILLVPLSLSDLSKDSTHVIIGTVADVMAGPIQYDDKHSTTRAFTDVLIDVEQDLAGTYKGQQIIIRTLGGMAGDVKIEAENEAIFTKGEKVVVFVNHAGSNTVWGDSFVVYGMEQGKYAILGEKAYGKEYPQGIPLQEFKAQIMAYRNGTSQ